MKKMKHLMTIAILITISINGYGQVGIGTTTPAGALDVTSTNDGLVIPRVALTNSTSALPLTTPTTSELVYNTATISDVTPGYYYWGGTAWVRLASGSGSGVETDPKVGTLTANKIPRWNVTTLADGVVTDDGTNVGVGITPSAGNKLDVAGKIKTTTFQMTNNATLNSVLQSDASGNASWVNANTLTISETDPQVSSVTNNTIPKWNGTALVDGVVTDDGTNVGVGITPSLGNKLDVAGKIKTTTFQMTNGATLNSVLQSDANGNASWATETDPQVSSTSGGRVPRWNGTTLVDGAMLDSGTTVGIGTAAPQGVLDLVSSSNGLLIPRVSLTNTSTSSPVFVSNSELVYNTQAQNDVTPGFYYWQTLPSPARWIRLITSNDFTTSNNAWSITGNTGTTAANFIGTTDNVDVAFKRNNAAAGKLEATNTSFGVGAGRDNTSTNNLFFGSSAGLTSSNGASSNMVAIGTQAMGGVGGQNVSQSVAIGSFAMQSPAGIATNNVVIGYQAGITLATSNNVIIGQGAGGGVAAGNCIIIGQGATSGGGSNIRIGTNQTLAQVPIAWSLISDRRAKSDIKDSALGVDFIKTLRPVSYFKNNDEKKRTEYGFIAQEVEEALINVGDKNNGVVHVDPNGDYSLRYNDFISISVKAIQEQQELIEALQKSNAELLKANAAILERLERLEKK